MKRQSVDKDSSTLMFLTELFMKEENSKKKKKKKSKNSLNVILYSFNEIL